MKDELKDKLLDIYSRDITGVPYEELKRKAGVDRSVEVIMELFDTYLRTVLEDVIGSQDKKEYWPVWKKDLLDRQRQIAGKYLNGELK